MLKRTSQPSVTQTGAAITSGSNVVTSLTTSALEGALRVRGVGIPRNTYVKSIESSSQVLLTKDATATNASASLTFELEPVMLAEAKDHLRIAASFSSDDDSIARSIRAARLLAENGVNRSFISTPWTLTLDGFDDNRYGLRYRRRGGRGFSISTGNWDLGLVIPWAEVLSVESIAFVDTLGADQAVLDADFRAILGTGGYVAPAYNLNWPFTRSQPEAVSIAFTAGYGTSADSVPDHVKEAILLLVGHFYENREATVTSSIGLREAPLSVQSLLAVEDWGYRG